MELSSLYDSGLCEIGSSGMSESARFRRTGSSPWSLEEKSLDVRVSPGVVAERVAEPLRARVDWNLCGPSPVPGLRIFVRAARRRI